MSTSIMRSVRSPTSSFPRPSVTTVERGKKSDQKSYYIFFKMDDKYISPWHDIPLYCDQKSNVFNMICEIPRWSNSSFEINTREKLNPLRRRSYLGICFPYHGYIWNYGVLPQTWLEQANDGRFYKGLNEPLKVIEIGETDAQVGQVYQVKVIAAFGYLIEGRSDWIIVAINVDDPMAQKLNTVEDINRRCPALNTETRKWFDMFRVKTFEGRNKFAFDGKFQGIEYAVKIIKKTNESWKRLVKSSNPPSSLCCVSVIADECKVHVTESEIEAILGETSDVTPSEPLPLNHEVNKVYYSGYYPKYSI